MKVKINITDGVSMGVLIERLVVDIHGLPDSMMNGILFMNSTI